jgi:hypothetical protein
MVHPENCASTPQEDPNLNNSSEILKACLGEEILYLGPPLASLFFSLGFFHFELCKA